MTDAFRGHGTYIYQPQATIARHGGSIAGVLAAMHKSGIQHAWVRIHGRDTIASKSSLLPLVDAMRTDGIGVAGWGWCQGEDAGNELDRARQAMDRFGLTDYVADVENEEKGIDWTENEIQGFLAGMRRHLGTNGRIAFSTYGFIDYHTPSFMKSVKSYVDFYAPQMYWYHFPNAGMLRNIGESAARYPLNNPVSYVNLCIDRWRHHIGQDIRLLVGCQSYWSDDSRTTQDEAEDKLSEFVTGFNRWSEIDGIEWWHFGGAGAMSARMVDALAAAKVQDKFPAPAPAGPAATSPASPPRAPAQGAAAPAAQSAFATKLVANAEDELKNFGAYTEGQPPLRQRIGVYWAAVDRPDLDGGNHDVPWSAAFISYMVRTAGAGDTFKYSAQHSVYFYRTINDKVTARKKSFLGYRIGEVPFQPGDIVGMNRSDAPPIDYDWAATHPDYSSHADIVVAVDDDEITTIGGNVGRAPGTVARKTFTRQGNHWVNEAKPNQRLFVVIRSFLP